LIWGIARAFGWDGNISHVQPGFFPELSKLPAKEKWDVLEAAGRLAKRSWKNYIPDLVFFALMALSFFTADILKSTLSIESSILWGNVVLALLLGVSSLVATLIRPRFLRPFLRQALDRAS